MSAAERMREAAAKACIALRDKWEADESHAPAAGAHICAAEILALPLPAPTPVEEAERRFLEAAENLLDVERRYDTHDASNLDMDNARCLAGAAYDALLAARQQEKEKA